MASGKYKLSIYLIKQAFEGIDDCLHEIDSNTTEISLDIPGFSLARFYIAKTHAKSPKWLQLFSQAIDQRQYKTNTLKAALYLKLEESRTFVITFGFGKSYIDPLAIEENFGFKTVANCVDPQSLKSIEDKSIIENPLLSKKQITKNTDISQFNIDAFTDILARIKGKSNIQEFGQWLDGKDSLSIYVETDLQNLVPLLRQCEHYHSLETYKQSFPQIDNILAVRDKKKIEALNDKILSRINNEEYDLVWTSVPEFYDEDRFDCFHYSVDRSRPQKSQDKYGGKVRYFDIELRDYLSFKKKHLKGDEQLELTLDVLKRDRITIRYDSEYCEERWTIFKCLYTEIQIGDQQYIFYDGNWYLVGERFINRINQRFDEIDKEDPNFPDWNDNVFEKDYLAALDQVSSGKFCKMDGRNINHDGRSKIEFCDLYTRDKTMIHVKKYGGSSLLSHLFQQGETSAALHLDDQEFREKVEKELDAGFTINPANRPARDEYTVWYLIGTKHYNNFQLPLFSRIAFVATSRELERYGFKVKLGYIKVVK